MIKEHHQWILADVEGGMKTSVGSRGAQEQIGGMRVLILRSIQHVEWSLKMKTPVWVLSAMLCAVSVIPLKAAGPDAPWLGVLWTKGGVSVGNASVSSGTTVLPGDVIRTAQGASAWVRFRSPASTTLLGDTEVVLLASDSAPSFLLRRGTVVVDEKAADPVQVDVAGGFVLVKGDPQTGAECELASLDSGATVSVKSGLAEIHGQGAPTIVRPGQSVRVEAGPQGGQPIAGKINKVIPQGQIQREGQPQELPLQLNQVVNWNDLVKTLQTGRAQITLLDGSTLNVGARSEIRIIKHDPQAQQTNIELAVGRLQANVQKITAPGGKFELRTKSAVIGTIDTAFVAEVDGNETKVCGVEGTTEVKSSDPNIKKTVRLHRNECTVILPGVAPTDPVLDPAEMASLLNQTAIQGLAGAGGGLAITGTHIPWVWIGIGSAAVLAGTVTGIVLTSGTPAPTSPVRP
jgi:ferric-dicitrate binding protein FerR (iron transport regulator)